MANEMQKMRMDGISMDKYEIAYIDHNLIKRILGVNHLRKALLAYFQEVDLHPDSNKDDGGCFQLYFLLKQTGFHIQQCLFLDAASITCKTTIAEVGARNPKCEQELRALIAEINTEIEHGQFYLNVQGTGDVQFWDRFSPEVPFGEESLLYYFENIERLIGYPQFLINRKYGTAFLRIRENT